MHLDTLLKKPAPRGEGSFGQVGTRRKGLSDLKLMPRCLAKVVCHNSVQLYHTCAECFQQSVSQDVAVYDRLISELDDCGR